MEKVNVYDFDKTILPYDSTEAFFRHCLRKYPRIWRPALSALPSALLMPFGVVTKTEAKERFYGFLRWIPDVDAEVEEFWREHIGDVNAWYLERRRDSDVVISASPEFLLKPVAERLGFRLIASRVDKRSGYTLGENNHGEEKLRRFNEELPGVQIDCFYSDSLSDTPLARAADHAYLVRGKDLLRWG